MRNSHLTSQEAAKELQAQKGPLLQVMAASRFNIESFTQDDEERLLKAVIGTPTYDFDRVLEALVTFALIEKKELKVPDDPLVNDAIGELVDGQIKKITDALEEAQLTNALAAARITEEMKDLAIQVTGARKYQEGEMAKALLTIWLRHTVKSTGASSGGYAGSSAVSRHVESTRASSGGHAGSSAASRPVESTRASSGGHAGSSAASRPETEDKKYKFGDVTKRIFKEVTGEEYKFGAITKKVLPAVTEQLTGKEYEFGDFTKYWFERFTKKEPNKDQTGEK